MKIIVLKDNDYTIGQINELGRAFRKGTLSRDEYVRELRFMMVEKLIDLSDASTEELQILIQADGDEQANRIMKKMNGGDDR